MHAHQHEHNHEHEHHHGHEHGHGHNHSHTSSSRTRLTAALAITLTVMVAELVGAYLTDSLSLATDAAHMLVDSTGLIMALLAAHLMLKPRTERLTWGFARSEVLAATFQSGMLIVICGLVVYESIERIFFPAPLTPTPMLFIGIIGMLGNTLSLLVLMGDKDSSLNMKAAFLEVLNDALGSFAVIVAAIVAIYTGWHQADIIASLVIVGMMVPRALTLLKVSLSILLESAPVEIDPAEVKQHFLDLDGVVAVHDLHISTIQTGLVALSAHVCVDDSCDFERRKEILHELEECTASHFPLSINHTTFQLETTAHLAHEKMKH